MSQFNNGISPGPRAEDVAHIWNCVAEHIALFICFEERAKSTAGPCWALFEELLNCFDGCLEDGGEFGDWGKRFFGFGGDFFYVVGEEVGADGGGGLGVYCYYLAGFAEGLFNAWVLAVPRFC